MDIAARASGAFLAAIACAAIAPAHAQQEPRAKASPYSLGLDVGQGAPGLSQSVVGRARLAPFSLFGKVGTTAYARPETNVMGVNSAPATETLSWGGGVTYDVTPRLTASLEWISYDLRTPAGPLRSASLGLKYRY